MQRKRTIGFLVAVLAGLVRIDPATLSVTTLYTMRKTAGFDPDNGAVQGL